MPLDRTVGNYFDSSSSFLRRVAQWKGPASYSTGGEAVSASTFGLGKIVVILSGTAVDATTGVRLPVYNPTTGKLAWYLFDGTNGITEVAAGQNLSTFSAPIEVIGQ
jgi:hypothetical protein